MIKAKTGHVPGVAMPLVLGLQGEDRASNSSSSNSSRLTAVGFTNRITCEGYDSLEMNFPNAESVFLSSKKEQSRTTQL